MMKRIAVLTSGGDSPGMNAAVRAVVRTALYHGMETIGVMRGFEGLMDGDCMTLDRAAVGGIIHRGGTILRTARSERFKTEAGQRAALVQMENRKVDALVVIGGDGSFRGARELEKKGLPVLGIPGTIDNDIACTEYTISFDTAMNTAMQMVDRLRDTSQSHERCSVVEIMGRGAGDLALQTGIAVGATAIIVPEIPWDLDKDIIEKMRKTHLSGKKHFIIAVAEGVGKVDQLAREIENRTGIETRATVLGHVQRGGSPSVRDRVIARPWAWTRWTRCCRRTRPPIR